VIFFKIVNRQFTHAALTYNYIHASLSQSLDEAFEFVLFTFCVVQ
jgi:hypothetical protein